MKLRVHAATDVGLVREQNEDGFLVDLARGVFAVADGLGGLPGGDVASRMAIEALRQGLGQSPADGEPDLAALVEKAHAAVRQAGRRFGPDGIGTTLTIAHIAGGVARIAHVGDSFALLVHGGKGRAVTREHNVENERRGPLELAPYPPGHRYALTRVVGAPEPVRPEFYAEKLATGDRLVLATDGLTDLLEPADVAAVCRTQTDPEPCATELVADALRRGGHDNVTVVVVAVDQV